MTSQRPNHPLIACGLMCWGSFTDSQSTADQPVCYRVPAAGCGWRTQSSSRCRWHCSRRGSACAAATQGAVPDTRHSIYGFKALCAGLTTWLSTNSFALCITPHSAQHMLTSLARHCSRFAGGCVQGIAVLCGLGPLRAEHTAAGGHSGFAHWRHAGLRVIGPQRPALCARPQGCAPCCSSCSTNAVSRHAVSSCGDRATALLSTCCWSSGASDAAGWGFAAGQPWWERRHLWEIVTFFCYRITELGSRIALLGLFAVRCSRLLQLVHLALINAWP